MTTLEVTRQLSDLLYKASLKYTQLIGKEIVGETIYAFVIHCNSGCEDMYIAIATHESLSRLNQQELISQNEKYVNHNAVNVAEWEYVGLHFELFNEVNEFVLEVHEYMESNGFEDVDLSGFDVSQWQRFSDDFFVEVIAQTITKLKESEFLNTPSFDKDLLMGALFSDPGKSDRYVIEHVSERVNSEKWHQKIKDYCAYLAS